ncbi:hypothetical protein, partial [Glutamicibacter protophormiae]|uniref:hypothetical protein n=1 Tax=Glutamicibacter protophormiae TaxID=37930 RepID=UPI0033465854
PGDAAECVFTNQPPAAAAPPAAEAAGADTAAPRTEAPAPDKTASAKARLNLDAVMQRRRA